ncbi:hypothetical protein HMPREF3182_00583 [Megasphaera hutchinsoni]|uniref:Thiamine-binding protein domain-containing protein n=2 Tax=Megasphaera hutchinsoni TaxID=1588748 RepID=A0A134CJ77_9FIRM|nr:hypothetical protein HMPREF3182_00583 [Megasphaera hutchinsoni]
MIQYIKNETDIIKKGEIRMNTLIALCIAPCGTGDEYAPYVAEIVRIIRKSGLPNRTHAMFTEIEGEWDDVMAVVKEATEYLTNKGLRTEVILKADIRPGYTHMMENKPLAVETILQAKEGKP